MRLDGSRWWIRAMLGLLALCLLRAGTCAAQASPSRAAAMRVPQLVDITARTHIRFNHLSAPDKRYIVESMSGGVAIVDYDRDDWPDLYFSNAPDVDSFLKGARAKGALFHNNHDGTFTDVTDHAGVGYPCWAMGTAVGDYNGDGWPDLLVTCFGGVVLYRNNGNGTFTDVTAAAGLKSDTGWATGASFADYNGDGLVDLFVPHYVQLDLKDLPALGSRKTCMYHEIPVQCGPRGLQGSPDALYRNHGDGTFLDVSAEAGVDDPKHYFGLTSLWSDLDGDGKLELVVANDGEPNYLYTIDSKGHFTDIAYEAGLAVSADGNEQANMGVALGDIVHNGRFSLAISHFSEDYTTLFRNDGQMSFTDVSRSAGIAAPTANFVGWGDAFLDINNEGWLDLLQGNGHVYPQVDTKSLGTRYREPKVFFRNRHDGSFADSTAAAGPALAVPQVSRGLAVGDLFNDGHLEIVIENLEGQPSILRAEADPANHWIGLQLGSAKGDRLALNARVTVIAGDLVQADEVRSGGSYLSQSDLRLHFGLGSHAEVDKVEVRWPSGQREVLPKLQADRIYAVLEGKGVVPASALHPGPAKP